MEFTGNLFFVGASSRGRVAVPTRPTVTWASEPPAVVEPFFDWLLARVGLDAACYRRSALLRRLGACLRQLRVASVEEARALLERRPELLGRAVGAVLLGVTQFHRDPAVFAALRERVLPELLRRAPRVRIWSAACSEGPELYSVAMVLEEAGWLPRAELLGTDCRPEAIQRAAEGRFALDAVRKLSPETVVRHFVAAGPGEVRVEERLRAATTWRVDDVLTHAAAGPWDLILWRNMAIYLTPDAGPRVWLRLVDELRPGGFLVAGKADLPPRSAGLVRVASCVFRKPEAD